MTISATSLYKPTPPSPPAAHPGRYMVVRGVASSSVQEALQNTLDTIPPDAEIVSINYVSEYQCWYITVKLIAEAK